MALTRRPRAGDTVAFLPSKASFNKVTSYKIGFATDDGIARNEKGEAIFIWRIGGGPELNNNATITEEGPDVPDPRSSQNFLHDGTPYNQKKES